ncbi:MAG TPA: hypothetical protein VIZ64_09675 [Dokdonella sp.]
MLGEYWMAGTTRTYWWRASLLMVGYVGAIVLATIAGPRIASLPLRALLVLLPVIPVSGYVWLEYRRILATDELRQRVELEAATLALAIGVPVLLAFGLLADAGILEVPALLATPLLLTVYVCAQWWVHRPYR